MVMNSSLKAAPRSNVLWRSPLLWRLLSGALVSVLALLIIGGTSIVRVNHVLQQSQTIREAASLTDQLQLISSQLLRMEDELSHLARNGYDTVHFNQQQQALKKARQALPENLAIPEYQAQFKQIVLKLDSLYPELAKLGEVADRNPQAGAALWQNGTPNYETRVTNLIVEFAALDEALDLLQNRALADIQSSQQLSLVGVPIVILLGSLLATLIPIVTLSRAVKRITAVGQDIEQLAEGDLRMPARLHRLMGGSGQRGLDEVTALEYSYVRAIEKLRQPLYQIQHDAGRISVASVKLSTAANQQITATNQQVTEITEVTVTVEELNQTAVQIADAAASVAAAAEQALLSASHGQDAVRDSIIGMAMIRSRVNDITSRILALSAQSQRISEIIDLIDTMAGQTHILALNAAVESAGAGGEVGERFGVVASEVKKLAQRSAAATREVRAVIAQVQAATNAAVMATEDGLKETEKGVLLAHQSGDANEDIIGMVERTAQLANAISLATQQQRTASEQVVATMREIALSTRQTTASSQQAAHAAGDLSDIAGDLRAVSTGFHLPDNHDSLPPLDVTAGGKHRILLQTGEGVR